MKNKLDIIEFTSKPIYFKVLEFLNRCTKSVSKQNIVREIKISNAYGYYIFDQLHKAKLLSINIKDSRTYAINITEKGKDIYSDFQKINQKLQEDSVKKIRTLYHAKNTKDRRKSTHTVRRSKKKSKVKSIQSKPAKAGIRRRKTNGKHKRTSKTNKDL